jgi:hypothetical protein
MTEAPGELAKEQNERSSLGHDTAVFDHASTGQAYDSMGSAREREVVCHQH